MIAQPACIHRVLDGKINEFILTETSRRAVDEMFDTMENILSEAAKNNPSDQYNPTLIDSHLGLQSLNHTFKRLQSITANYPDVKRARIAIIVPPNPLAGTITKLLRTVTPIHFYKPTEREQALAWLRQPASSSSSKT